MSAPPAILQGSVEAATLAQKSMMYLQEVQALLGSLISAEQFLALPQLAPTAHLALSCPALPTISVLAAALRSLCSALLLWAPTALPLWPPLSVQPAASVLEALLLQWPALRLLAPTALPLWLLLTAPARLATTAQLAA